MQTHIVTIKKEIEIIPMTRLEYNIFRGWTLPDDECGADEGYLCKDIKTSHVNWIPSDELEACIVRS